MCIEEILYPIMMNINEFVACYATYDAYFKDFDQAFNISIDRKVIRRLTELTDDFQETEIIAYLDSINAVNIKM